MECLNCDLEHNYIPFIRTTIIDGKTSTVTYEGWAGGLPAVPARSTSSTPRSTSVKSTTARGEPPAFKPSSSIASYTPSPYSSTIPQSTTITTIATTTFLTSATSTTTSTEVLSLTSTQTTLPSQSPHSTPHSYGLPEAAKAMIGIGAVSAVILAGFLSWLYLRHKRLQKAARQRRSDPFPWLAGLPEGDDDRLRKPHELQVLSPRIKAAVELGLDGQKYELPGSRTWKISRRPEVDGFF
ncbi:hypothetical protein N7510_009231 [Penicillium lagena]|uniref:uncharacterized protein n=1 Tax=Penicillium lagena TaxID=94218 RepID=UPI0025423AA8|nr:uncharacterized protein N7510_009231 [Penicillium lagena]KAJ5606450.1 hypothetical protein N7510_009231 [Penicillium lagena]